MNKIESEIPEEMAVSEAVIETVAEAQDIPPVKLTPPLFEAIDLGALDRIFADRPSIGKVIFNYNGCVVSVFSDGYVAVEKHGA